MGKPSRKKKAVTQVATAAPTKPRIAPIEIPDKLDRTDFLMALGCAIVALAVYLKTLCPTIYTSGAGENITAVALLGVPHPPGFPLFCLLGKIFTVVVPVGSIAFRVNLFSAFCGSLATGVLFLALRSMQNKQFRYVCAAAALMLAFSRTFWSQAVIAEVYTLNALILSAILFFISRWQMGGSILPVGLIAGLGLAVHPLQALFFPGWILLIWKSPQRQTLKTSQIVPFCLLFAAGLLFHVYPLLRSKSNPVLDWGNPENFSNWIEYLTAAQYRDRMFSLKAPEVIQNLWEAFLLFAHEWSIPLVLLPPFGAWILFRTNRKLFVATTISAAITILYAINYNIPWEIDVYYIPVILILCIWSAWGLQAIVQKVTILRTGIIALVAIPLIYNFSRNDLSNHRIVEAYGNDVLKTCPPDALVVIPETDASFAMLYLKEVLGFRKDVEVWVGNAKELKELKEGVNPDVKSVSLPQLLQQTQRPFFLSEKVTNETIPGFEQFPHGVLYRVLPEGKSFNESPIEFASFQLENYVSPIPSFHLDTRSKTILAFYLLSKGDVQMRTGRREEAIKTYETARQIAPDYSEVGSQLAMRLEDVGDPGAAIEQLRKNLAAFDDASSYNRLGRLLAETGQTDEAMSAFLRAIELDPKLAIAHTNLGALYAMKGDLARAEKELLLGVQLDPVSALARNNLARLYLVTGRNDQARKELEESLRIDPNQPQVRKQLEGLTARTPRHQMPGSPS